MISAEPVDVRARDDVLIAAGSGMIMPRPADGEPAEHVLVGRGASVCCRDGLFGSLEQVLLDPDSDMVRALVVDQGPLLGRRVIVPAQWVESAGETEITLKAGRARVEALPEYRPAHADTEITAAVHEKLSGDERTRGEAAIDVQTSDGVVHLGGVVHTAAARQAAAELAHEPNGIWEVVNDLQIELGESHP